MIYTQTSLMEAETQAHIKTLKIQVHYLKMAYQWKYQWGKVVQKLQPL